MGWNLEALGSKCPNFFFTDDLVLPKVVLADEE